MDRLVSVVRVEGMDKKEKNEYYKNMRNEFDIESEKWFARQQGFETGKQEGIEAGLVEGRAEEKTEIARNFKALGIDVSQIAKATGLSLETIARL